MKNYPVGICITILALCISASSSQSGPIIKPTEVSFCDLLSAPKKYEKQIINTKALIRSNTHEVLVFDPECRSTATNDRSTSIELATESRSIKLTKRLSKILRHDRTAKVTFVAIFDDSGGQYGYGMEGTRFHFFLQHLITVEEVPISEPGGKGLKR